jgi:hypothetical protein
MRHSAGSRKILPEASHPEFFEQEEHEIRRFFFKKKTVSPELLALLLERPAAANR